MPQPPKTDNAQFISDQLWGNHTNRWFRPDGPSYVVPVPRASRPAITTAMFWYNENGVLIRDVTGNMIRGND